MSTLIHPLVFTALSQFSSDFQCILNRAGQLASLPMQQMQNHQPDIGKEKTLAANMSAAVGGLASSVGALAALGNNQALSANSTDSAVVTATVTGATTAN